MQVRARGFAHVNGRRIRDDRAIAPLATNLSKIKEQCLAIGFMLDPLGVIATG